MTIRPMCLLTCALVALTTSATAWADTAVCSISIRDIKKGNTYKLEHTFQFERGSRLAQRKHFDTPGGDFKCTLAFFELRKGTMLSCELNDGMGTTFVQSDRTLLHDPVVTNNLSFSNRTTFLAIDTRCE